MTAYVPEQDHCRTGARRKRLRMIAAQPLNVEFQELTLHGSCSFVLVVRDQNISQSSEPKGR